MHFTCPRFTQIQAVLMAHLCHRYHDLASWASDPLKQRIHYLARPDGSNLKDLLMLWDEASPSLSSPHTTPESLQASIDHSIHSLWSPDQSPLAPPHIWACSSWESAPVFRRKLDSQTIQALVPVARLNSQDLWGIVLLAEAVTDEEDDTIEDKEGHHHHHYQHHHHHHHQQQQQQQIHDVRMTWKYHHLIVVSEQSLISEQNWKWMAGCSHTAVSSPQESSSLHTSSAPSLMFQSASAEHGDKGRDDDNDDDGSDDDYWGQYGDAEDVSTDETAPEDAPELNRGAGFAPKTAAAEEDEDDDDDDYWCKYADPQEEDDESDGPNRDSSSETLNTTDQQDIILLGGSGALSTESESRRIFASLEDTAATAGLAGIHAGLLGAVVDLDSHGAGQVDATTLSMLLERLITHSVEESAPRVLAGRDNSDDGTDNEADNEDYFEMQEDDVSLHLTEDEVGTRTDEGLVVGAGEVAAYELESSQPREDVSSSTDSILSKSPSCASSFVSCASTTTTTTTSTGMNTAQEATSMSSTTLSPKMALHEHNHPATFPSPTSTSSASVSPLSTLSCTDSAYQEDSEDPFNKISSAIGLDLGPADSTAEALEISPQESVRQTLQVAVRKAMVSGISKTDLFDMLTVIYEDPASMEGRMEKKPPV
ncbi:MAG: hypothetical protein J3Q66DRAFT_193210 [Benniella sp.]|nr:MAG: hypothetical protein J3Q66DRAFT_193210 [Benniella sp.]